MITMIIIIMPSKVSPGHVFSVVFFHFPIPIFITTDYFIFILRKFYSHALGSPYCHFLFLEYHISLLHLVKSYLFSKTQIKCYYLCSLLQVHSTSLPHSLRSAPTGSSPSSREAAVPSVNEFPLQGEPLCVSSESLRDPWWGESWMWPWYEETHRRRERRTAKAAACRVGQITAPPLGEQQPWAHPPPSSRSARTLGRNEKLGQISYICLTNGGCQLASRRTLPGLGISSDSVNRPGSSSDTP